jgi:hypothetical protein
MKRFQVTVTYQVISESGDSGAIYQDIRKFMQGDGEPTATVEYVHHDVKEMKETDKEIVIDEDDE